MSVWLQGWLGPHKLRPLILLFLLSGSLPCAAEQALSAEPMLPKVYSQQTEVTGWLMSEKLDGVRGYWDGRQMRSKNGNRLYPPPEFTMELPPFPLEGELWGGRNSFEKTAGIVSKQSPHDGWLDIRFAIFDVPQAPGGFSERMGRAEDWLARHPSAYAFIIPQISIRDQGHMQRELQRIEKLGGEGLIVRRPDALYASGRSTEILKVKNYLDAEAKVLTHLPGKGKYTGQLGALLVELEDGTRFKIGSGFSDRERQTPPPVGSVITFKFYGKYASGIPKFPSFLRIRRDQDL